MASGYAAIVVGVGGMGSATVYQLAKRGLRVLGLERFDIPHHFGSSHGVNRIIRLAYSEHPSYVPLLRRAFELWVELERQSGEKLLYQTGSIDADTERGQIFAGSLESCRIHGIPHQVFTAAEVNKRFPGYRLPAGHVALFQPDGGFLLSERCIVRSVEVALGLGAEVHAREAVLGWEETASGEVKVTTDRGHYRATSLIFTAGAWTGRLLSGLIDLAVPERQVLGWFQPRDPELFSPQEFPVFSANFEEGHYYGLPIFQIPGFKIGRVHHLGEQIDPDYPVGQVTRRDEEILRMAVARYFPEADGHLASLKTCLFTNSPDEHFILDTLPDHPQVVVAAGFSGHGFKFCSVVGEILADLATRRASRHDISLFRLDRFER